jgi:hypothetical protein
MCDFKLWLHRHTRLVDPAYGIPFAAAFFQVHLLCFQVHFAKHNKTMWFFLHKFMANDTYEVNFVLSSIIIIFFLGKFSSLDGKKRRATSANNFQWKHPKFWEFLKNKVWSSPFQALMDFCPPLRSEINEHSHQVWWTWKAHICQSAVNVEK